jgi:hypothetical protein
METQTDLEKWEATRQAIYELTEYVGDRQLERIDAAVRELEDVITPLI